MIVDGLIAAEPHMKIAEQIFDPNKFLYLTDDIMSRIQSSEAHVGFNQELFCPLLSDHIIAGT
jgi:hypothetical protein